MSLPALRAVRERFPGAYYAVQAVPWVADLYVRERFADAIILYNARRGASDWAGRRRAARRLRAGRFDAAILLTNSFDSALGVRLAGIPVRIGYARDGRGWLLTEAVAPPLPGEIPRHERFYYLELLRRAGILNELPACESIQLDGAGEAREAGERRFAAAGVARPVVGVSPGAAYGGAKRWLPERFAEAAALVAAAIGGTVAVFGSRDERPAAEAVTAAAGARGVPARNFAGDTSLAAFIEMAAASSVFLTNDSGAMHVASALGIPTVAVFGATDDAATGPAGPRTRVVREPADCSPCLLRECPIDHRCMTRVAAGRVAAEALELMK
jgi:heptosyltransferase-2